MNSYLGMNGYVLLGFVALTYFTLLIEDKGKRVLYKMRIIGIYLFGLASFYLYYLARFHMNSSSQELLMREIFYKWKMGTVGTYLFYLATTSQYLYAIMGGLAFLLVVILCLLCVREIRIAKRKYKRRKIEAKRQAELNTKIAIKQQLEKAEKEKTEQIQKAKEQEIRNMVDKIFPDGVPEDYKGEKLDTQI
jgi:hypothetical protein